MNIREMEKQSTRSIYYIEDTEDTLTTEVKLATSRSLEENLEAYCQAVQANYAMMGIDVSTYPIKRKIHYIEDGPEQ